MAIIACSRYFCQRVALIMTVVVNKEKGGSFPDLLSKTQQDIYFS